MAANKDAGADKPASWRRPVGQQVADSQGMSYVTVKDKAAAIKLLDARKADGHSGYITPVGPNGAYGHEVRFWKG